MASSLDQAVETQLRNIETRTGLSREALAQILRDSGLDKHAALLAHAKATWGLGHGDANALALMARRADAAQAAGPSGAGSDDPVAALYDGKTAGLRAVHDAVMAVVAPLGPHEVAAKKGYVALRRKKQFAMLGPKGATRVELGINLKEPVADPRLKAQPPGGMCQYTVGLRDPADVDPPLAAILRRAYDAAG